MTGNDRGWPAKTGVQLHLEIDGWQEAMARETADNSPLAKGKSKEISALPVPFYCSFADPGPDALFWPDRPKGAASALPYYKLGKLYKIEKINALFLPRGADYLERLASWAADFSAPDFSAGAWVPDKSVPSGMPPRKLFNESQTTQHFFHYCCFDGWVKDQSRWGTWMSTRRGRVLLHEPEAAATADLDELVMMITTLLLGERFSYGYYWTHIQDGTMLAVCQRAGVLAAERAAAVKREREIGPDAFFPRPNGERDTKAR